MANTDVLAHRARTSTRHSPRLRAGESRRLEAALREHTDDRTTPARRHALRKELVLGYRPFAERIAWRYRNRGIPLEDLQQVATIGLINALDRYRPERGSGFLAYAIPYTRGEIQRHFRDTGWTMRVPRGLKELHLTISAAVGELSQRLGRAPRPSELAEHLSLPLDEVLDGLQAGEAYSGDSLDRPAVEPATEAVPLVDQLGEHDPRLDLVEYRHALRPLIAELPERERTILILRFFRDQTQTQIGQRMGMSQMHVSRLLSRTLTHLRDALTAD